MDILSQYDKQFPEQKQAPQKTYEDPSEDHAPIISWVIKMSGGRIQNERQASYVLLMIAGILTVAAIIFFVSGMGGGSGTPLPYEQTYKPL